MIFTKSDIDWQDFDSKMSSELLEYEREQLNATIDEIVDEEAQ